MKRARDILESLYTEINTAITDVTARIMPAVLHHGLPTFSSEIRKIERILLALVYILRTLPSFRTKEIYFLSEHFILQTVFSRISFAASGRSRHSHFRNTMGFFPSGYFFCLRHCILNLIALSGWQVRKTTTIQLTLAQLLPWKHHHFPRMVTCHLRMGGSTTLASPSYSYYLDLRDPSEVQSRQG